MKASPKQREALRLVAAGKFVPTLVREEDGWYARWRPCPQYGAATDEVLADWVDELVRTPSVTRLTEDAEDQHHETLHDAWLMALKSRTGRVIWADAECAQFAATLADWQGRVEEDPAARAALNLKLESDRETFTVVCDAPATRRGLKALGAASEDFPPLRALRRRADGKLAATLTRREAEAFLRLTETSLAVSIQATADLRPGEEPTAPVQAKLVVKVDGEAVSAQEIRFLLEQGTSLVFFRNRWIEVDRSILRAALRALEKAGDKTLTETEAVSFALGLGAFGALELAEVRAHGWLRGLVNELKAAARLDCAPVAIPGLQGELRAYQARGVAWMKFLTDHKFGALLADDMGLGKTVQTIGWLLLTRAQAQEPFLVIAPLTLLSNWRHEFQKFAPHLKVWTHHGEGRHLKTGFLREARQADVVLTSYSLLTRDYELLRSVAWAGLVLDEAQAIKNANTQVAQAARALGVPRRVALTGTPIENQVGDVWSLEEFLNPTFLGDKKTFTDRFVKPLAADEHSRAGKKLKRALEPFILRRVKSDPEIAGELGAKREIKEYCVLSPEQRLAYEAALDDFRVRDRKEGDIFALLTELKLICDGSGKQARLVDLLAEIFAAGESALIFTQYAKVGTTLQELLTKKFGKVFPFLHGGLDTRARDRAIATFCEASAPMAFILSLRAGGFGLNLTKATHVIHFDRWWNPAVENQATDRAHRIGQDKAVFVHTFITEGTIEERIDELLSRKERLAGSIVTPGEAFLRELLLG